MVATLHESDAVFSGGNEYVRLWTLAYPLKFSQPPAVLLTKSGNNSSYAEISLSLYVHAIGLESAILKYTSSGGGLAAQLKNPFEAVVIGVPVG